jgi:hypothetical protein
MKLEGTYRLFGWIQKNIVDGQKDSYGKIASRAAIELGIKVSAVNVKSALAATGIKIKTMRGGGIAAMKTQIELLREKVEELEVLLDATIQAGSLESDFVKEIVEDETISESTRELFKRLN